MKLLSKSSMIVQFAIIDIIAIASGAFILHLVPKLYIYIIVALSHLTILACVSRFLKMGSILKREPVIAILLWAWVGQGVVIMGADTQIHLYVRFLTGLAVFIGGLVFHRFDRPNLE
ncbi:hypothetical protein [Salininema proteolyticum]|uniref:Uncharacterized protein n=1 Tax=Salininema proteolyticum TaxID=1607685 RepID=A0ABV8U1Y6_9ACTN